MFAYLLCHLVGVTSTVINPIMYAMLNYDFQNRPRIAAARIRNIFVGSFRVQETETQNMETAL